MPLFDNLTKAFRLFSKRKAPSGLASRYPLSLSAGEWRALKDLVAHPAWAGFRALLEHYAELRADRLLQPLPPDQTNVERGAVGALFAIAALPEQLIAHVKEIERAKPNLGDDERSDFNWQWGSPLFADRFRTGSSNT